MSSHSVRDRYGNLISFTEERWQHILESRPELEPYFELFLVTLGTGRRQQDSLAPNQYKYIRYFDELFARQQSPGSRGHFPNTN